MRKLVASGSLLLVVACAPLAGGGPVPAKPAASGSPCTAEERLALNPLLQETQEWADTVREANATPQAAQARPIAQLQELRGRAQAEANDWPACAKTAYALYLRAMDAEIASRQAFAAGQPYESQQAEANRLYEQVVAEMRRIFPSS